MNTARLDSRQAWGRWGRRVQDPRLTDKYKRKRIFRGARSLNLAQTCSRELAFWQSFAPLFVATEAVNFRLGQRDKNSK